MQGVVSSNAGIRELVLMYMYILYVIHLCTCIYIYNVVHINTYMYIHVHVLPDVVLCIMIQDSHKTGLYDVITISNRHIHK